MALALIATKKTLGMSDRVANSPEHALAAHTGTQGARMNRTVVNTYGSQHVYGSVQDMADIVPAGDDTTDIVPAGDDTTMCGSGSAEEVTDLVPAGDGGSAEDVTDLVPAGDDPPEYGVPAGDELAVYSSVENAADYVSAGDDQTVPDGEKMEFREGLVSGGSDMNVENKTNAGLSYLRNGDDYAYVHQMMKFISEIPLERFRGESSGIEMSGIMKQYTGLKVEVGKHQIINPQHRCLLGMIQAVNVIGTPPDMRAILFASKLPKRFWYITPQFARAVYGHTFGAVAYVHNHRSIRGRDKSAATAEKRIFVGYAGDEISSRMLVLGPRRKVWTSKDVVVRESSIPREKCIDLIMDMKAELPASSGSATEAEDSDDEESLTPPEIGPSGSNDDPGNDEETSPQQPANRYLQRVRELKILYVDDITIMDGLAEEIEANAAVNRGEDTSSVKRALEGPEREPWIETMVKETNTQVDMKAISIVRRSAIPEGAKQIPSGWRLTKKYNQHGEAVEYMVTYLREGTEYAYMVTIVDDILVASNSKKMMNLISKSFLKRFRGESSESAKQYGGIGVERDLTKGTVKIFQTRLIDQILKAAHLEDGNPVLTPMVGNIELVPKMDDEITKKYYFEYRSLLGMIQFVSNTTRPDITFAANALASYSNDPGDQHFGGLKRIARYLKGTRTLGITYSRDGGDQIKAAFDATWGSCITTRRSVGGSIHYLAGAAISWESWRMQSIKTSSMHAELGAVVEGFKRISWYLKICDESKSGQKVIVSLSDNQSVIKWLKNPRPGGRAKHIDISFWWVVEKLNEGRMVLYYVPTARNTADAQTKALVLVPFREHRDVQLGFAPFPVAVAMSADTQDKFDYVFN